MPAPATAKLKLSVTRESVRAAIGEIGIIPVIREYSPVDARFAADAVLRGGIPIVEVTMAVPGALQVLQALTHSDLELIVGAGSILDVESARECADAGASFLASAGFDGGIAEFAAHHGLLCIPGALTPTEIMTAWKVRPDFIRVFPCANVGGAAHIRSLKMPFPDLPLIAAGGINQQTAAGFFQAGASAISLGGELIPRDAIDLRQEKRIIELARRFRTIARHNRTSVAVN
jgi:2-dehydro-3-deoxyphosphogluconate aldolase/(4S)-4-hydroxy-2-oxoglutarate aldolase